MALIKEKVKNNIIETLERIAGKENVLSDESSLEIYSCDSTNMTENERADAVVFPENTNQVSEIMKYANANKIPVVARAAGTSVCGACLPKFGGIILNLSKMNKITKIDKDNLICEVQAGVIIEDLQKAVEEYDLFYPPDPSNLKVSMLGGSIGLSSGGPHTFKYGSIKFS